jgi:anti-anti-sigma factor
MELAHVDLEDGVRKVALSGRMDVEGTRGIDLRFTALTVSTRTFVVVDLSGVDFIASLGNGTLVRCAKAARLREGNMILLSPQPNVAQLLTSMGIDLIIPVCWNLEDARAQVRGIPS